MPFQWTSFYWSALPILVILASGFLVLIAGLGVKQSRGGHRFLLALSLLGILSSGLASFGLWSEKGLRLFNTIALITVDPFAFFFYMVILLVGALSCLSFYEYFEKQKEYHPEIYSLTLFSISGMMVMVSTSHLLVFFLGLEVMSLAIYVLVGIKRRDSLSNEAALKYFILGALAAGIFLYGVSLLYGVTGYMDLKSMSPVLLRSGEMPLFKVGALLVFVAFAFKIAAVPFHFWTPDVYQGAPTPVTGFMSTAVKVAAFGALLRVLFSLTRFNQFPSIEILQLLCLTTMVIGNLVALSQTNLKRMLAYSSIAHAGYVLVGVCAAYASNTLHADSLGAPLFYLMAYSVITIGAFAVASAVAAETNDESEIDAYRGLSVRSPKLAAAMSVFMLALTGIPPTVGFAGKFFLFREAAAQGLYVLVIVGVLMSAVSAYYYLRVIVAMYFSRTEQDAQPSFSPRVGPALAVAIVFCVVTVLYMGVRPSHYLEMSKQSRLIPLPKTETLPADGQ